MPTRHAFTSPIADGSSANDVRSTHWNADHIGSVLGTTAAVPEVLARWSGVTVSNSSAVNVISSYSVPARTLGTNRMLRWTMAADAVFGSTAVPNNFQFELFHGSSRWRDTISTQAAPIAGPCPISMTVWVAAAGTSANRWLSFQYVQSSGAAGLFGAGDITAVGAGPTRHFGTGGSSAVYTISTGAAELFEVRFNWLGANSSLIFRLRAATLELV